MSYVVAGYSITFVVLGIYFASLKWRRGRDVD